MSPLRHTRKCTITESQRVTENDKWSVILDKLDKFIGLVIARGVFDGRTLPTKVCEEPVEDANCSAKLCHMIDFWK